MRVFRRRAEEAGRWIVLGLGNPGDRYEGTRHNAGAAVVHHLANVAGTKLRSHRSGCLVAETTWGEERIALARPASYMNESGRPARALADFYKVPSERLVVVHDELDIPFGEVRIKTGGGTAGHNGLKSLASHLGTKDFVRVRVGIGRPREDATDHVLARFSATERKVLPDLIATAADAVERVVVAGADRAMNEFNTRAGG